MARTLNITLDIYNENRVIVKAKQVTPIQGSC